MLLLGPCRCQSLATIFWSMTTRLPMDQRTLGSSQTPTATFLGSQRPMGWKCQRATLTRHLAERARESGMLSTRRHAWVKTQKVSEGADAKTGNWPMQLNTNASRTSSPLDFLALDFAVAKRSKSKKHRKPAWSENVILKIRDTQRMGGTFHGIDVCWRLEKAMPTTSTCAR